MEKSVVFACLFAKNIFFVLRALNKNNKKMFSATLLIEVVLNNIENTDILEISTIFFSLIRGIKNYIYLLKFFLYI